MQNRHAAEQYKITLCEAELREQAWNILLLHNAPASWPPWAIDCALNAAMRGCCVIEFNSLITEATKRYEQTGLKNSDLIHAAKDPTQRLILNWCFSRIRNWQLKARSRFNLDRDDLAHQIRFLIIQNAPTFIPHDLHQTHAITHGFEAWITWKLRKLLQTTERSEMRMPTVSLDAPLDGTSGHSLHSAIPDCRLEVNAESEHCIKSAIRSALRTTLEWDLFVSLAYDEQTFRTLARKSEIPRSSLSRKYARPIVHRLRANLGPGHQFRKDLRTPDIRRIARLTAQVWSHAEFLDVFPRPVQEVATISAPSRETSVPTGPTGFGHGPIARN